MAKTRRRILAGLILSSALQVAAQTSAPTTVLIGTPPQPGWSLLSTEQKIILAPLAKDWDSMENVRRKKWLGIAERFPRLSASEQARVQKRMHEWVSLTPEQRAKVRDSYKEFNQLPPEKRQAVKQRWDAYTNLSSEEKEKARQTGKLPPPQPTSTPDGQVTSTPPAKTATGSDKAE